jgi:hypothetical protein
MRYYLILSFSLLTIITHAQNRYEISDMKWGADFNIHITFSNDSTSIHDVKALYHTSDNSNSGGEVTYYPVSLDPTFIENLKNKNINSLTSEPITKTNKDKNKIKTLWSTLHPKLGGGYIHFINSIIYALESGKLNLTAPLMTRPISTWKPKPMTQTYKRTKKWKCFIPNNQKLAHKEFKIQAKNGELGDIELLPTYFVDLFKNTTDKQYARLKSNKDFNKTAIIDMIRLLLAAKYLGNEQIDYIENAVIKSVMHYNINNLPSVIVFDNYEAAVAMTLDNDGYKIEKVVINNEELLSTEEVEKRLTKMEAVIHEINEVNKMVFEKKLKNYYTN